MVNDYQKSCILPPTSAPEKQKAIKNKNLQPPWYYLLLLVIELLKIVPIHTQRSLNDLQHIDNTESPVVLEVARQGICRVCSNLFETG